MRSKLAASGLSGAKHFQTQNLGALSRSTSRIPGANDNIDLGEALVRDQSVQRQIDRMQIPLRLLQYAEGTRL